MIPVALRPAREGDREFLFALLRDALGPHIVAGQLKLNRVFLLPSHQGRGIGSQLIRALADEADASGVPVRLRVFKLNPARHLYERFGFRITGEIETHFLMERAPRSAGTHVEQLAR